MMHDIDDLCTSALKEVFAELGFPDVSIEKPSAPAGTYEVMSTIGLTGDLGGYLLLRSNYESAVRFANRMADLMGLESGEIDTSRFGTFHREALSEVSNQLSGRTIMRLAEAGYDCNITPPTILTGNGITLDLLNLIYSLERVVSGDFGNLGVFVGLKKAKNQNGSS